MFFNEGASLALLDANGDAARNVGKALGDESRVLVIETDVSNPGLVQTGMAAAAERFGALDVLVNSAGVREIMPAIDLEPELWHRVITVNLSGTFYACQAFARIAKAKNRPAGIVNVSSTSSIFARPSRSAYVSSKHGVTGLTKQLALELGPLGIRVNAVAPGVVRTPLTESYFETSEGAERMAASYPLGRVAEPNDVASVILFLASDEASFITGTTLPVDGGYTAGMAW